MQSKFIVQRSNRTSLAGMRRIRTDMASWRVLAVSPPTVKRASSGKSTDQNKVLSPTGGRSNIVSFFSRSTPHELKLLQKQEIQPGDAPTPGLLQQLSTLQGKSEAISSTSISDENGPSSRNEIYSSGSIESTDILALVGLTAAVSCICSLDRSAMSVAILPMSAELHWDASTQGAISSAFFLGYTITNLAGGYLATRWCPKAVLGLGVFIWSLFTVITPMAATSGSLPALLAVRGVMGIGEGVAYPSIQNLVRQAVPSVARTRAISFISSGHQVGTIASYVTAPGMISSMGWQSVFEIFGSLGFLWLLGWGPLVKLAAEQRRKAQESKSTLEQNLPRAAHDIFRKIASPWTGASPRDEVQAVSLTNVPWGSFFSNSPFWAIVAAQATVGIGACLSFAWLPTFYSEKYDLDVATSASFCVLPTLATIAATNAAGWMADELISRGILSKTNTRKLMQGIGSFGPAACLLYLASMSASNISNNNLNDAVIIVTAWLALGGFSAAGYGSNHQDLGGRYAGVLFGISNGVGSIAGSASIFLTGKLLHDTDNWSLVFSSTAAMYGIGAALYLAFASAEDQGFDQHDRAS